MTNAIFIFIDFPKGEFLRETGIPLHKDRNGVWNLDEDEVKLILKKVFEKQNLDVFSFSDHLERQRLLSNQK